QGGSVDIAVQPLTLPQLLACLRIEAPQVAVLVLGLGLHIPGLAQDELILIVHLDYEGRAPGTVGLKLLPDRFAGSLVDREKIVPSLGVVRPAPEDGKAAVQARRSAATERVLPLAQIRAFPQLLASVIETVHARRGEADDNTLAVKHGRAVAVPGRAVGAL